MTFVCPRRSVKLTSRSTTVSSNASDDVIEHDDRIVVARRRSATAVRV